MNTTSVSAAGRRCGRLVLGTICLLAACSGEAKSLLSFDVSLEAGVMVDAVEIVVAKDAHPLAAETFPWSRADADGVLRAGVFLRGDVEGDLLVKATGRLAGNTVAMSRPATVKVVKGKTGSPAILILSRTAPAGVDGGVEPGGRRDAWEPSTAQDAGATPGASTGAEPGRAVDGAAPSAASDAATDAPTPRLDLAETAGGGDAGALGDAQSPDATVADAGPAWTPAENIEKDPDSPSSGPQVAVDPSTGDAWVVWRERGALRLRRWDQAAKTWDATQTIESRGQPADPVIRAAGGGLVFVVWRQETTDSSLYGLWGAMTKSGKSFAAPIRIDAQPVTSAQFDFALSRGGTARAIWEAGAPASVHSARFDGTWAPAAQVRAPSNAGSRRPRVAIDEQGNGLMTWQQEDVGNDPQGTNSVFAARFVGATVESPVTLDATRVGNDNPAVAVSADGAGIVAWSDSNYIRARAFKPGTGWGSEENASVMKAGIFRPPLSLGFDRAGNAHAAWSELTYPPAWGNVRVSRRSAAGAWTTAQHIDRDNKADTDPPDNAAPRLAVSPSGIAHVVWRKAPGMDGGTRQMTIAARTFLPGIGWTSEVIVFNAANLVGQAPAVAVDDTGHAMATWTATSRDAVPLTEVDNVLVSSFR